MLLFVDRIIQSYENLSKHWWKKKKTSVVASYWSIWSLQFHLIFVINLTKCLKDKTLHISLLTIFSWKSTQPFTFMFFNVQKLTYLDVWFIDFKWCFSLLHWVMLVTFQVKFEISFHFTSFFWINLCEFNFVLIVG